MADEGPVDDHELAAVVGLDMAFAELRDEAFEGRHLLFVELHDAVGRGHLQLHQPAVLGVPAVAAPYTAHPAQRDLDASQPQLADDPQSAVTGVGQAIVQERRKRLSQATALKSVAAA